MWANASELSPTRTQILPGMDHFLYGLSDEMKQAHREQLFTISHKKLLAMSDRYLGTGKSTHGLAILRPENPKIAKDPSWIIRRWAHEGSRAVTPAPMSTLARVIREFQIRSQQGPWLGLDEKLAIRFFKPPPWWF
ncbi:presequence protease, mitochondrial-like isoform X6 [Chlorocebus sabaeus]|uniref:presequence protease, mitochondrial-like isoform X3 n=1 Tax=Chlorocebus sabaeus TaxID=60711 RepID=UPI003BF9B684